MNEPRAERRRLVSGAAMQEKADWMPTALVDAASDLDREFEAVATDKITGETLRIEVKLTVLK
jgi:hypothetical protein